MSSPRFRSAALTAWPNFLNPQPFQGLTMITLVGAVIKIYASIHRLTGARQCGSSVTRGPPHWADVRATLATILQHVTNATFGVELYFEIVCVLDLKIIWQWQECDQCFWGIPLLCLWDETDFIVIFWFYYCVHVDGSVNLWIAIWTW